MKFTLPVALITGILVSVFTLSWQSRKNEQAGRKELRQMEEVAFGAGVHCAILVHVGHQLASSTNGDGWITDIAIEEWEEQARLMWLKAGKPKPKQSPSKP